MHKSELDNLARKLAAALVSGDLPVSEAPRVPEPALAKSLEDRPAAIRTAGNTNTGSLAEDSSDVERLASQLNQLKKLAAGSSSSRPVERSLPSASEGSASSTARTIVKTIGMATGVGPLITGLTALFGSRDPEPVAYAPEYLAPASIRLDAGLGEDRQFRDIAYSSNGTARPITQSTRPAATQAQAQPAQPTIQVNVQAMDSRSFLDHSDEIAKAVREAMLHSHALNDVVSEL